MKNFEEKAKQVEKILDGVRDPEFFDAKLKIAYYDIIKVVREAYYEGHDDGVAKLAEIIAKNQEKVTNILKN